MFHVTEWFAAPRPDHPMSDIKQAKRAIAALPAADSVKALEKICFWLKWITDNCGIKNDRRFCLIDLLDEAAKNHQCKIREEYLSGRRLLKNREHLLWDTAFIFSK